jgi:hypothetical protein
MKKINLNSFGVILDRNQMKMIFAGANNFCKATCGDGSLVGVTGCSSTGLACSESGGVQSCKCDYPGPFDPPPFG